MGKQNGGQGNPPAETSEDRIVDAVSRLPENLAILRMENDNIVSMAKAEPRDHKSIIKEIVDQLTAYPAFAKVAVYAKPVGKDQNGQMKIARGLSIRAAEAIAAAYKYNRVQAMVTPGDKPDSVTVAAIFVDYQAGRIWKDAGILSMWYKTRGGQMVKHAEDRFNNVVVKAEVSRRVREVILRSVPPGLRQELLDMVEKALSKLLDDPAIQKIIGAFKEKNISQEQLEKYVGRPIKLGWREEDRLNLLGLHTAIEDGETTIEEAFGDEKPAATSQKGESQVATLTQKEAPKPEEQPKAQPQAQAPPEPPKTEAPALEDLEDGGGEDKKKAHESMINATMRDPELFPDGTIPVKAMKTMLIRAYGIDSWTAVRELSTEQIEKGTSEKCRGLVQIREDVAEYKRRKAEKAQAGS